MMGRFCLVLLFLVAVLCLDAHAAVTVRAVAAAGEFYPENPDTLRTTVQGFFDAVQPPPPDSRLVACIVPHSAYGFSGRVAAHAFKHLKPGQYDTVIVIGPSHFKAIEGCSIAAVETYYTPLGPIPLDGPVVRTLCYSPLISAKSLHYRPKPGHVQLHEREFSIEVVLPFLQERLGPFQLVPIIAGDLRDQRGKFNENILDAVVEPIRRVIDARTLLVVSSDFTHYGSDFGYVPFTEHVLESIEALDREAFKLILEHDVMGFQHYLDRTGNNISASYAIQILLRLLPKHTRGQVLAHQLSARLTGRLERSVSYAAINFYDPDLPPLDPPPKSPDILSPVEAGPTQLEPQSHE